MTGASYSLSSLRPAILAIFLAITLAGCVSLAGTQTRIVDPRQPEGGLKGLSVRAALAAYDGDDRARGDRTQREYRDYVVTIYQTAIEANYSDFSSRMSSERRELGLGTDAVQVGLTNYAAVARSSIVNELSAAAAGFAGLRGALDRNVYFDRTVPALVGAMDTERARIEARIADGLTRTVQSYSLHDAFRDLSLLESAGSIDRAVVNITGDVAQQRQEAERLLATTVRTCNADADATPVVTRLSNYLRGLETPVADNAAATLANTAKLRRVAVEMALPVDVIPPDANSLRHAIFVRINDGRNGRCAKDDLDHLVEMIERATGDRVP